MFERVCDALIAARIERGDLVVALGGGVVGDLAGFAAAIVRRGLDFVQVPTTLLAQVDSSVGGKTAINTRHGKNLSAPSTSRSWCSPTPALLDTLPRARVPRRLCRGRRNTACSATPASSPGWRRTATTCSPAAPARASTRSRVSCRMKAEIVARDERETGDRALLNLGHTFGHALEAAAGFSDRLLHGEAVALGMALAFDFSARARPAAAGRGRRASRAISASVGLPTRSPTSPAACRASTR